MLVLKIGKLSFPVSTLAEASQVYCDARDLSGEGASTFPSGKLGPYRVSYNGRVWQGEKCVYPKTR